jgi:DNA-binding transcriptional regulator YhcF (GntR family)
MGRKVADMTRQLEDTAGASPTGASSTGASSSASRIGAGALAGIDRRSAIDAVRLRIGMAISLGLLKPGERLPDQEDVALGLSVSPITARRALASLADQGVVVRRRGRAGGTFVADEPPRQVLAELTASPAESQAVNRLVDRRLLFECAVTHYAAVNASAEQLDELERLTRDMAESTDWSAYHQADEQFHQLVGTASGWGPPSGFTTRRWPSSTPTSSPTPSSCCTNPTATTSSWWRPSAPETGTPPSKSPASTWTSCTGPCSWV